MNKHTSKLTKPVPAPLYEDPIWGGPSDPTVIWNREEGCWWMFYTSRRAAMKGPGVAYVHGTDIGVASSKDGCEWVYRGVLTSLHFEPGHNTFWAPEVIYCGQDRLYHMYVTYIRGVPDHWCGDAKILHFTAENMWEWIYQGALELDSDRVIDACVYRISESEYKMWYKDESRGSRIAAAVSRDLFHWEPVGVEIGNRPQEGPNVFELGGRIYMITDLWEGLGVYVSSDFSHWDMQEQLILDRPGTRPMDSQIGNHADVVVSGEEAYIFYFVHPDFPKEERSQTISGENGCRQAHTVIQAARLYVEGGILKCDRDEEIRLDMQTPQF